MLYPITNKEQVALKFLSVVKTKAVLTKKFLYKKNEEWISVPKGTEIIVDENESIALIGNDHVEVQKKDYKVLFPH